MNKRLPLIKDVISLLRESKRSYHKVVIPLLISQINGLLIDIARINNISFYEKTPKGKSVNKSDKNFRNEVLYYIQQSEFDMQNNLALNLIGKILFGKVESGENLKNNPYKFNRHKIMHGEKITGLTKSNMVRTFLILDFLGYFIINSRTNNLKAG